MPAIEEFDWIDSPRALEKFCDRLSSVETIAFDTEFVSEDTFRTELCLVQVAAGEHMAAIDTLAVRDLRPFWQLLAAPGRKTIVHAGREELLFCLNAIGGPPHKLFDLQIAAGMVGLDYPAGYGNLIHRLLGERLEKSETRTDWRRRPLSDRQIAYAMDDVRYLAPMQAELEKRLVELGRLEWLHDEMLAWQRDVAATLTRERWRRVSGISGLSPRSLAIVRELCAWRDREAERRNVASRRVLRDDLIIELAKRRSADPKQIRAIRGFERGDYGRLIPQLAEAVERGLALPDAELPRFSSRRQADQFNVLGQFLSSALAGICRAAQIAPSLVGTAADLRELIAYRLDSAAAASTEPPSLAQGWRAEIVGQVIDEFLQGNLALRVHDPHADEPLSFLRIDENAAKQTPSS
jgi:ribonuclease D